MTGNLATALTTLLKTSLPTLVGGTTPPVQLNIPIASFNLNPDAPDSLASQPRPDDRTDTLPFNPNTPTGPYTLTLPPYPGPRRIWLVKDTGDLFPLRPTNVLWAPYNSRQFSLQLDPSQDLTGITHIQVLYSVTAIFTQLKGTQTLHIELTSDDETALAQAQALVMATIALNRQTLIKSAQTFYESGDYGAEVTIKQFNLQSGRQLTDKQWQLTLEAEFELKATRALAEDEGAPIERILTVGHPETGDRPIDIQIGVEV